MNNISFRDGNAKRIYQNYMARVKRMIRPLANEDKNDVLLEIKSHIDSSLQASGEDQDELDAILNVLDRLGEPEEFLKPMIEDKMLDKATSTFHPKYIVKALLLNLKNGFIYSIYSILYLSIFLSSIMLIIKFFYPKSAGYYLNSETGDWVIGITDDPDYVEKLGSGFIPIVLLVLVVFYVLLTFMMKLTKKRR